MLWQQVFGFCIHPMEFKRCTMKNTNNKIKLTRREKELLEMFSEGKTSSQCATELNISYFTVETHRKNIHHKLGTHKMLTAVNAYAAHSIKQTLLELIQKNAMPLVLLTLWLNQVFEQGYFLS